jgi:hypothetical protein
MMEGNILATTFDVEAKGFIRISFLETEALFMVQIHKFENLPHSQFPLMTLHFANGQGWSCRNGASCSEASPGLVLESEFL